MHVDRNLLGWGVFFIVVGAVPLAVEAGIIGEVAIDRWWSYWPLILVGIGLSLLLSRTPLDGLGGLVLAGTFGLMVGGALAGGLVNVGGIPSGVCGGSDGGTAFAPRSGELGDRARVGLKVDCGSLTVTTASGPAWTVSGTDEDGSGPHLESSPRRLEVRSDDLPGMFLGLTDLAVALPTDANTDLELDVNAGSMTVDLAGASLDDVDLELNAGDATFDLRGVTTIGSVAVDVNAASVLVHLPAHSMRGAIEVNAGSIDLCAPSGVGLRLDTGDSVLSSHDYAAAGLVQSGSTWETPGYDTAAVQIALRTEARAGSYTLDGERCG
ncbi:MAG TPA: hypothetical protein VIH00_08375 [Candidatus Limnocylindrales bacterium]